MATKLNKQQEDFAQAVLTEKTAVAAWKKSHPGSKASAKTAKEKASRLLQNPKVAQRIAELREEAAGPAIMTLNDILIFWSLTTQNGSEDIFARLSASNSLARHYYKLEGVKKTAEESAQKATKIADDFAQFCERQLTPGLTRNR